LFLEEEEEVVVEEEEEEEEGGLAPSLAAWLDRTAFSGLVAGDTWSEGMGRKAGMVFTARLLIRW
jgi:hypothetical protein